MKKFSASHFGSSLAQLGERLEFHRCYLVEAYRFWGGSNSWYRAGSRPTPTFVFDGAVKRRVEAYMAEHGHSGLFIGETLDHVVAAARTALGMEEGKLRLEVIRRRSYFCGRLIAA